VYVCACVCMCVCVCTCVCVCVCERERVCVWGGQGKERCDVCLYVCVWCVCSKRNDGCLWVLERERKIKNESDCVCVWAGGEGGGSLYLAPKRNV